MNYVKIPKLRFREFNDEWQVKKLGDLLKVGSGRDYKHLSKGTIPVYGTGGLMLYVDDYLYDGKSICIGRKGTIDKPQFLNGKFWTVDTLFYTHSYINSEPEFLYLIFQKINWKQWNEASGVPSLSKTTIEKIKVNVPCENEQKKIASFLSAVNDKCSILQQKIDLLKKYKNGASRAIFTQKLRFKDENGKDFPAWQEKKLSDIFDRITYKNTENNQNILTISAQQGLVSQTDYFNKIVAAKNVTNYYLLQRNDFAYNKSYSAGYPMGAIKCLKYYDKGVVSTLYICFRAKYEQNIDFFEHVFDMGLQNLEIEKIAQEGARNHGLLNIAVGDFFNVKLQVPVDKEEQKVISNFLTAVDDKINLEESKLKQAKNFKKALLQQMFI